MEREERFRLFPQRVVFAVVPSDSDRLLLLHLTHACRVWIADRVPELSEPCDVQADWTAQIEYARTLLSVFVEATTQREESKGQPLVVGC